MARPAPARPVTVRPLADPGARAAYADLLAASPHASPFLGLAFADASAAALGLPGSILLVGPPEAPDAGAVLLETRRGPFRAVVLPPHADEAGPVLRAPLVETEVHARASPLDALIAAVAARAHQVSWRLPPDLADARPFLWTGWDARPAYQYVVDLQAGESAVAGFGRTPARTFRLHRDDYAFDPDDGRAAAALETASLVRKGVRPLDERHTAALGAALVASGEAHAWTVRPTSGGPPEAAAVIVRGGETATYWIAGGSPGPATTVLIGRIAEWARKAGVARLSLGGANVPDVAEFKRKLGATLVPHLKVRLVRHPLLRLREPWVRW
jgi:hypothetical protein